MALPNLSGIYAIRHIGTGRVYVGSSLGIRRRTLKHRCLLNAGKHQSQALQAAWKKYGQDAFVFEVLELVTDRSLLLIREQHWMDHLKSYVKGRGFNVRVDAACNRRISNSLEARHKQRLSMLALFVSEPWRREEMRARSLGRKMTQEAIEKSAKSRRGRKASEQHRANLSKAHTGVPLSAAHKAAIDAGRPKSRSAAFRASVSAGIKRHWETRRAKSRDSQSELFKT